METHYHINENALEIERCSHGSSWKMPVMHCHASYELTLFEKGSCNFLVDEYTVPVEKYDILLLAPNVLHKNNGGDFHTHTVIYFTPEYLEDYYTPKALASLLACFSHKKMSLKQKDFEYIFNQAMLLSENPDNFTHLGNILSLLSKQPPAHTDSNRLIDFILQYINNYFNEINNLTELANCFYISKEHLCRIFKKETGFTVIEYLNSVRIRNACDMLRLTKKPVTEIGFYCGFHSTMYFNKIFKRIVKMTPTEFRKTEQQ